MRGDNYCAVRAATFQALSSDHPLPSAAPTLSRLQSELAKEQHWWTFANRLSYTSVLEGARDCLETLERVSGSLQGSRDREADLTQLLNRDETIDVRLCEAVKLHMLASAKELYEASLTGSDVPLFAIILFARESSDTIEAFVRNHLNVVGDTGGLEQVRGKQKEGNW